MQACECLGRQHRLLQNAWHNRAPQDTIAARTQRKEHNRTLQQPLRRRRKPKGAPGGPSML
eukprot:5619332-Alexandrium_andersonii.AAC.1